MKILQQEITITTERRGYFLITNEIEKSCDILKEFKTGIANIFLLHTSASLTINENADSSVREDFKSFEEQLVPRSYPYQHDYEGSDDMPAHIKSSIFGNTLSVPVKNAKLYLGTWQGIYLNEHRDYGSNRKIIVTVMGE